MTEIAQVRIAKDGAVISADITLGAGCEWFLNGKKAVFTRIRTSNPEIVGSLNGAYAVLKADFAKQVEMFSAWAAAQPKHEDSDAVKQSEWLARKMGGRYSDF